MSVKIVPLPSGEGKKDAFYFQIQGLSVQFLMLFNARDGFYYLDVGEIKGIRCITGFDLLGPYKHLDIPAGALYFEDTTGLFFNPDQDNLSVNVFLKYDDGAEE